MKRLLTALLLIAALPAHAQRDSLIYHSDTVALVAKPLISPPEFDRVQRANVESIRANTSLFLKSSSPGGLTTMSYRGGTASQTPVLWHGLNIGNPMLGQLDLSLLEGLNNEVGFTAVPFGAAAYGLANGVVYVSSPKELTPAKITLQQGSFGRKGISGSFNKDESNYHLSAMASYLSANNDFTVRQGGVARPFDRLPNAKYALWQQQYRASFGDPDSLIYIVHAWLTGVHRQLPPTLIAPQTREEQDDNAQRIVLARMTRRGNIKLFMLRDQLIYKNPEANLYAPSTATQAGFRYQIDRIEWRDFTVSNLAQAQFENALGTSYQRQQSRLTEQVALGVRRNRRMAYSQFVIGGEWLTGSDRPALSLIASPQFNIQHERVRFLGTIGLIERNPTLNDRYWQPGGNPDLKPEQSRQCSLTVIINKVVDTRFQHSISERIRFSLFYTNTRNAIVWLPTTASHWQVTNLSQLVNQGAEAQLRLETQGRHSVYARPFAQYLHSRNIRQLGSTRLEAVPLYQPAWQVKLPMGYQFNAAGKRAAELALEPQYWSRSYVTTNNDSYLPPVYLLNLVAAVEYKAGRWGQGSASLRINNLLDYQYQVVAYRPMPGINYQLTVSWQLP